MPYRFSLPQTGMAALLEERREAKARAAHTERLLDEARAAAGRVEGKVGDLEVELRNAASRHAVDSIVCAPGKGTAAEEARAEAMRVRCGGPITRENFL